MLGDNTSFGIQRSASAAIGDVRRATATVRFAFPLREAVTTRLLELCRQGRRFSSEAPEKRGAYAAEGATVVEPSLPGARECDARNATPGILLLHYHYF